MGLFDKLKSGLAKTRGLFTRNVEEAVRRAVRLDGEFFESLEEALILSDVGAQTARELTAGFQTVCEARKPTGFDEAMALFQEVVQRLFDLPGADPEPPFPPGLSVLLIAGVNGSGKTTSIGKLACHYAGEGKSVMLAACDTFRAAAIEQLEIWAQRAKAPLIKQKAGSDPSAVIYDAVRAARARGVDLLIADTAGRLHTQSNLMEELKKIRRVAREKAGAGNLQTWLVLDATLGQNSIQQARFFHAAVPLDAFILTKMDGAAKGGMALNVFNEFRKPIRFIGVGEAIDDLLPFNPKDFGKALFPENGEG